MRRNVFPYVIEIFKNLEKKYVAKQQIHAYDKKKNCSFIIDCFSCLDFSTSN